MKKLLCLSILILFSSCTPLLNWQTQYPDNLAEEYVEYLIEDYTGYDVDLTPVTGKEKQTLNPTGK